jgi:primosomal protein N' (replication factor Y)
MPHLVQIALPLPTPRLFTYAVPPEATPLRGRSVETQEPDWESLVGRRALAPFGKRVLTGVIVGRGDAAHASAGTIRPIIEILDVEPAFSPQMLAFARWIADYYLASLGETLKTMLPQGMSPESVVCVAVNRLRVKEEELREMSRRAPRRYALLQELLKHEGEISVGYLEHIVGGGAIVPQLEALETEGFIERRRVMTREARPKTARAVRLSAALASSDQSENDNQNENENEEACQIGFIRNWSKALRAAMDALDRSAPKQAAALGAIALHYSQSGAPPLLAKDLARASSDAAVKALVQKGYVEEFYVEVPRAHFEPLDESSGFISKGEADARLTAEQDHALDKIAESLDAGSFKTFLLHGVTGSGKTLIYIRAIQRALAAGKSALLLVPEIALTPQLIERFRAAFGEEIGVMHSHRSVGERFDAWRLAKQGKIRIIIGARSAVFAPLKNLGVIIVDEEHEPSYKQDGPAPRYNARDCAIVRASLESAVVVLGSATPSLETMFNARAGKYHLLEITRRADGAQMPSIGIVDVRERRKQGKMHGAFSEDLLKAIALRLEKREGVILFHNRRGFASRFECLDCGHIPMCPNCAVPLTYHKYGDRLRCHYCGYSREAEKSCTNCGSIAVKEIGSGTQRVEDELKEELAKALAAYAPNVTLRAAADSASPADADGKNSHGKNSDGKKRVVVVQRMDLDATSAKGSHERILRRFAAGEIDILLGTQMVAKGLDFARVTLVGVVNADLQLYLPDFRAAERTFQLLTQVAGRAGRSSEFHGEVIIQTAHPKHQTVVAASVGSYELFYNDELQFRREAVYPPFARFVMIEFSGKDEELVSAQAQHFAYFLPRRDKAFERLGPASPSIARLRGLYRRIVVVKNYRDRDPSGRAMRQAILKAYHLYNQKYPSSAVRIRIDVDAAGFV